MKHQSKENRASIVLFLLFLCFVTPRAKSQVLLENDSSVVCKVIDIVNVGLSTEIQKKYEKEYIATSVIVGYNLRKNEVEFYWLDDRYDFDLYSSQKGDSITLHYPHMSIDNRKRAIAMDNHSFQERIREFLKWEIAKRRFMEHIIEDNQGLHTLDTENADDLRLSKRTFGQLYCIYILMHNETIRNKE